MILQGKSEVLKREKHIQVPHYPPQIPHRPSRDRTQASTVGKQAANHISHDTAKTDMICIYITYI